MAKVLWTQKQDMGPRPRVGHAMTYDATRQRVVLFGGDSLDGLLFGDTWEWEGENWTQVQDIGPNGRAFHAIAFDSIRQRTVLFGGRYASGLLGDTWEWSGEDWTQVADSGPVARFGHAMSFDANRQRIVLFGGDGAGRLNDTWEWDGNEWVQQGDSGPSARIHSAMAYDSVRGRLVLFGGAAQDLGLGDTWEWNGTAWTEESDFGPDACAGGAMVFKGTRTVLFGGIASIASAAAPPLPALFGRSWEWDGKHWTARQDMGPGNRAFHAMAFDEARSRVVLFGGSPVPQGTEGVGARAHGDTWEQFEEGQTFATFGVASIEAAPNPTPPGTTVILTVTLTGPAPPATIVTILTFDKEIGTIKIAPGGSTGTFKLPIAADAGAMTFTVTARVGSSEATTELKIKPTVDVDVTSVDAVPNPVAPGETLVITVTLGSPAPAATSVELLIEDQSFSSVPIAAGAMNGALDMPIDSAQPPATFTLTARSGDTEAHVTVSIQS
jgi:hypothetical protein